MYVATILVYLVVIVAIGVYFKRYVQGVEDFALAGRSLGLPILLGTLFATYIGGATVVGWTGSFYEMGFDWWFSGIGALLGICLATFVMAERCRRLEQFTVPDLLALRYDNRARYVSSAMIVLGDVAIVTVQIIAIAGVLVTFTGLGRVPAMVIGVVSFTLISLFGGMRGVAVTDSLQALLIFGGLLAGTIALFGIIGGERGVLQELPQGYFQPLTATDGIGVLGLAVAALGTTAVSQSLIFTRIFSARDERTAKLGMLLLIPTAFLGYLFVAIIGYGGRMLLGPDVVPDDVFATVTTTLLPAALGGLLLAVIIAAIVTSTNSILLSASVNVARDFYQQLARREVPSVELRRVGQIAVIVFALFSLTLAVLMPDIVTAIVFAYTMYSAGLLIPLYLGYLWRGATATAGMLGVIGGGGTALAWYILGEPLGLPPIVPAIAVSLAAVVLVSLFTQRPSEEQLRVFDI